MAEEFKKIDHYKAINWNDIEDPIDQQSFLKLVQQFWEPERIPVSNDLKDWRELDDSHKWVVAHVFGGLTLLDTLQSQDGLTALKRHVTNQKQTAVLNNIQFMETIHAKSYSTIFSTLNTPSEIREIFEWTDTEELLQNKARWIGNIYRNPSEDPLKQRVANVFLETGLFYSGFYTPLYYLGHNQLVESAEIIKLILRDESVHGTYIGYLFQKDYNLLSDKKKKEMKSWVFDFLFKLYENEEKYVHLLYDQVNWTDKVLVFSRYNFNKALMNLGFEPLFPETINDVEPTVATGISTSSNNHDFFSTQGNSYLLAPAEEMQDDDYDKWSGIK